MSDIQDAPIKNNPLEKKILYLFKRRYHGFEPNFQILYASIHAKYPANFIETTNMVQQIQQFKL